MSVAMSGQMRNNREKNSKGELKNLLNLITTFDVTGMINKNSLFQDFFSLFHLKMVTMVPKVFRT